MPGSLQLHGHTIAPEQRLRVTVNAYLANLGAYARWIVEPLGVPLVALSLAGAALSFRGGPRDFLPLLVHLPVTVLVMSSAGIVVCRPSSPTNAGLKAWNASVSSSALGVPS